MILDYHVRSSYFHDYCHLDSSSVFRRKTVAVAMSLGVHYNVYSFAKVLSQRRFLEFLSFHYTISTWLDGFTINRVSASFENSFEYINLSAVVPRIFSSTHSTAQSQSEVKILTI